MPVIIRVGTWLYVAGLVVSLALAGHFGPKNPSDSMQLFLMAKTFSLLLALPIVIFQGFLLYKVRKARSWARYALLAFVAYTIWEQMPIDRLALNPFIWPASLSRFPVLFAAASLQVLALASLFSKSANRWFRLQMPKSSGEAGQKNNASNATASQEHPRRPEYVSFLVGTLVVVGAIGGVHLIVHSLFSMSNTGESAALKPGDANYPVPTTIPTLIIPLIVSRMELSNYKFVAEYTSDVKLCGHDIGPGGYFAYGLSFPIEMVRTEDDKYHGSIVVDKFQPGRCGWKFRGAAYQWPDGGGNSIGTFTERPFALRPRSPHIDMWCYKLTEGKFKTDVPNCEILALLRWPNAMRFVSPEFISQFSTEQQNNGNSPIISTDTEELSLEFHDLNAAPGALLPLGNDEAMRKAAQQEHAIADASPEARINVCLDRENEAYIKAHRPLPDSPTQQRAVFAMKNTCRAELGLPPADPIWDLPN